MAKVREQIVASVESYTENVEKVSGKAVERRNLLPLNRGVDMIEGRLIVGRPIITLKYFLPLLAPVQRA